MIRILWQGICLMVLFFMMSGVSYAQDPAVVDIFKNGFYGGLAGALVGAAALAFTDEPEDHLNFVPIGAGIGVVAGTAYGIYTAAQYGLSLTPQAIAEVQGSRMVFHLPVVQIHRGESSRPAKDLKIRYTTTLLKVYF